jgi:hypothetical protein
MLQVGATGIEEEDDEKGGGGGERRIFSIVMYGCETLFLTLRDLINFKLHSGGWSPNWVHSARRPLTGLMYLPRVIVRMENLVE